MYIESIKVTYKHWACAGLHPQFYTPKNKNETTRFLGDGVSFKAKLIGILEVSEARGDRMCQEALSDLKIAIRAAGEHKQRITINIAIDGLRLRDEKTGDSLYHHPVHKISFIAQDMTDSRAFGYIFGSPDTGHRFFGIKTDKAASQVVIAMRDLFQVVFALKKKEIELAKQHLEKTCYPTSPLFSDTSTWKWKNITYRDIGCEKLLFMWECNGNNLMYWLQLQSIPHVSIKSATESKMGTSNESKNSGTAVADLVDLELELNSLQQGLNQMERITPSDPFGSKDDPFGDSFINYPAKPILPPPPSSGRERSSRTSDSGSLFSPKTPQTGASVDTVGSDKKKDFSFSQDFSSSHDEPSSGDWITSSAGNNIFEEPPLPVKEPTKDEKHEQAKKEILSQFDVFTELDPLVRSGPNLPAPLLPPNAGTGAFAADPFGEDPFVKEDPFADSDFSKQDPFETEFANFPNKFDAKKDNLQTLLQSNLSKSPKSSALEKQMSLITSSPKTVQFSKQNTFDLQFDKFEEKRFDKLSHLHENPSLDVSSESECAPEPPPRPTATLMQIKPPPLPPKKQINELAVKPPPRPPYHSEESPYDFMEKYETAPSSIEYIKSVDRSPPLPVPSRKSKFETDFTVAPERPKKQLNIPSGEEDYYLTPISFPEKRTEGLLPPPQKSKKQNVSAIDSAPDNINVSLEGLDIRLSQLTLSGLNELANKLNIPASQLSNMTLCLENTKTETVSNFNANNEFAPFQADFAANFNNFNNAGSETTYDRYAVFRELMQEEIKQTKIDSEPEEILEEKEKLENSNVSLDLKPLNEELNVATDRYAALREIVEIELKQSEVERNGSSQIQNEIEDIAEEEEEEEEEEENVLNEDNTKETEDISIVNRENKLNEEKEKDILPIKSTIIEYSVPLDRESWAIFDQGGIPSEEIKEKQAVQSEEGISPWSSDSKEFGNGSPPDWKSKDSGSGPEHWSKRRKDQEGWWDTSAEPEVHYYPSNRRSTDSYDEEYYESYERPRRRRQANWQHGGQATGGHSSSSRDVSPWEEEPRRREPREGREPRPAYRHPRGHSFERHRRQTDSWDEEDDYEYDDEQDERFHWTERQIERRDTDRDSRHSAGSRDHDGDRWADDWNEDRRHRKRRDPRERWCCPDWEQGEHDKAMRYGSGRWSNPEMPPGKWRDRKHDDRYYSRESQDSPWEDEYVNDSEESPHYLSAKRNWRQRPSSASEMDRKLGEMKPRHYIGTDL
ncbi:hypothetical protein NQ318_001203 [Aromia moschata]|uniref:PID domain-containing protein n=1 Tax=Aromia moschata TaxID=1265417 RepID=A0AAV8ZHN9_9CUCU|nr:hypothetical protein NQ318_001203 [Aromia moschata]